MMTIEQEIEEWAKRCNEEKIAIAIFCDGNWRQLGGPHHLYDLSDEMSQSKVEMAETIRLLKRKLEKTPRESGTIKPSSLSVKLGLKQEIEKLNEAMEKSKFDRDNDPEHTEWVVKWDDVEGMGIAVLTALDKKIAEIKNLNNPYLPGSFDSFAFEGARKIFLKALGSEEAKE